MINTYKNAAGQTVAQDARGMWRIYHAATGTFGVFAEAPSAEALRHPVPVQHLASSEIQPPRFEPRRDQQQERQSEQPARSNVWMLWVGGAALVLAALFAFEVNNNRQGNRQADTNPPPPPPATQTVSSICKTGFHLIPGPGVRGVVCAPIH